MVLENCILIWLNKDYQETAKKEIKKGKNWNTLLEEKQSKLIKYWGYEKARIENELIDELEAQEKQARGYEKEVEIAKFHEERGKIKCKCWQCESKKQLEKEALDELWLDKEEILQSSKLISAFLKNYESKK